MRILLKSKIHFAKCTETQLNSEDGLTIDKEVLQQANIYYYEQVQVINKSNGVRILTYALPGNTGQCCLNGPAAHHFDIGDELVIISYEIITPEVDLESYQPITICWDK